MTLFYSDLYEKLMSLRLLMNNDQNGFIIYFCGKEVVAFTSNYSIVN